MLIPYTAPEAACRTQTEIQKSLFIADLVPVSSMEEAATFWDSRRKEFRDATHHCFACRIGTGQVLEKSSDDGEPQGTAGHPMLHVLQMQELTNTVLVVTRYFGGIKLGAGGLTRAYSGAAASACRSASLVTYTPHLRISLVLPYDMVGLFEKYAGDKALRVADRAFTDTVTFTLLVPPAEWEPHLRDLTNLTAGRARAETLGEEYVPLAAERK